MLRKRKSRELQSAMIVSDLPPSRILGSLATSIQTVAFNCFISTARRGVFLSRWTAMFFDGDPGVDAAVRCGGSVEYWRGLSSAERIEAHRELSSRLNGMGENGTSLGSALEAVIADFARRGMLEEIKSH
jgi:hypothetical protein